MTENEKRAKLRKGLLVEYYGGRPLVITASRALPPGVLAAVSLPSTEPLDHPGVSLRLL